MRHGRAKNKKNLKKNKKRERAKRRVNKKAPSVQNEFWQNTVSCTCSVKVPCLTWSSEDIISSLVNVWIQQQLGCIISVNDHHRINGFERGRTSCFEPFYSWVSALAVSVWPTFVRVYKLVQVQPTWSLYASPNFLSSPPIRILSPHEAREWCQWRFLPTLSFLSGPWYSPQYISFTVRQHRYQALKAGDFSLIEHCTKEM